MQIKLSETGRTFGRVLKRLRDKRDLKQRELEVRASMNSSYCSLLELGKRSPTLYSFLKIARALNMRPDQLMREYMEEEKQAGRAPRTWDRGNQHDDG